jgi:hypothetical protein
MKTVERALVIIVAVSSMRCARRDSIDTQSQSLTLASSFYIDGQVTVNASIAPIPSPAATCPGGTTADVCGSWEGVELDATKTYSPTTSHDSAHCFCHPIAFQIPAYLPVTRGTPGVHKSTFSYHDTSSDQMVSCRYDGDGKGPMSGTRYVFRSCSNGAAALSSASGDSFLLSIDMGELQSGTTEVKVKIGAPDVVNGALAVQDFVSTDPRLAGAVLHVPRGAAPPFQTFSLSLADSVPIGAVIGNQGDGATTVGPTVGFTADGTTGTFYFNSTPTCARVELPYDPATAQTVTGAAGLKALGARQVLDPSLVGDPNATSLARLGADIVVDTTNHTISFCVEHLSYYVGSSASLDASVDSVTIGTVLDRTKLKPDTNYDVILNMKNLGTTPWIPNTTIVMGYRTAANPSPPMPPWRDGSGATLTRISGPLAPTNQGQIASFITTLRSPMTPGAYEFSWCMLQNPGNWFGQCYDSMINVQYESCNGLDDDGDGLVDNGVTYSPPTCNTGRPGICAPGTLACIAGVTQCVENTPPTTEICDGLDNNCDGNVDDGVQLTFYRDNDQDGWGDPHVSTLACSAPTGYVANAPDCNDFNSSIHQGAPEVCNGVDDNCDGRTDEYTLNGGVNCGLTADFTNIDDDISVWTGDAVNGRGPNLYFHGPNATGIPLCGLFSGCGTQDLLFKIGNGGCFNSGGDINIRRNGQVIFSRHRDNVFWFDCGYTYRVVVRFNASEGVSVAAESGCGLPTDCAN